MTALLTRGQRRRTQIRLAQRAYRLRKESTISSLKDRVTKLEGLLDETNNIFLAFKDTAIESGILRIKPQLASKLEQTTERFAAITRTSVQESEHEDLRTQDRQARDFPTPESDVMTNGNLVHGHRSSRDSSSRTSSRPAPVRQPHTMGYELFCEGDWLESVADGPSDRSTRANSAVGDALDIPPNNAIRDQGKQTRRVGQFDETKSLTYASPMLDYDLQAPFTYSFQESTFARRLHRASIERGYSILTSPNSSKEEISRIFALCFYYSDVPGILYRTGQILKRSCNESLDNWAAPFLHLGGAGTHYPRLDAEGNNILLSNMRPIGPQLQPRPQTPPPRDIPTEQLLLLIGWDGVWLDPNDVEQYLRTEKGLRVDGHSMMAEMEVPLDTDPTGISPDPGSLTDSSMNNVGTFSSSVHPPSPPEQTPLSHDLPPKNRIFNPYENQTDTPSFTSDLSRTSPRHATLTIDLQELLSGPCHRPISVDQFHFAAVADSVHTTGITQRCVHIGRTPGFRKADVDSALQAVMQRAF